MEVTPYGYPIKPISRARPAASTRERQSSLRRMLRTCMSTVRGLRKSSWAISRLVRPTATRRTTSSSRRESRRRRRRPRRAAEPLRDRLAERGDLARRLGGQRPGAELARGPVGVAEALERRLALAGGGQRDAGAQLDLRALERDVEVAVQLDRARELLGGRVGVALEQRDLADRVGERGERVAGGRSSEAIRVSASAQACAPARSPRRAKNAAAQRSPQTA